MVRESDGRLLPSIMHRVSHQWVSLSKSPTRLHFGNPPPLLICHKLPDGPLTTDIPFANITLVGTSQHFLDIRSPQQVTSESPNPNHTTYSATAGTCARTSLSPSTSSASPFQLQLGPSTGNWTNWISCSSSSNSLATVPATSTAQLFGFYDGDGVGPCEKERGQAFDAVRGEMREYEDVWEGVPKMVMVPEEGQRAVGIVLKTVNPAPGDDVTVKGMVMRVAHVLQGVLVRAGSQASTTQDMAVERWMYSTEKGWEKTVCFATDYALGEALKDAVKRCRMDIDELKLGGVIDASGIEWEAAEISWSKTKAQLAEIERRKQEE